MREAYATLRRPDIVPGNGPLTAAQAYAGACFVAAFLRHNKTDHCPRHFFCDVYHVVRRAKLEGLLDLIQIAKKA